MPDSKAIDSILVQWGDRLFYPGNRVVQRRPTPRLRGDSRSERAAHIRGRIQATVVRRSPQVMVKVTGGGRGMKAIASHFRYISKNGRLEIEDDQGNVSRGKATLFGLTDDWRYGGSFIGDESPRREAFNIVLSMPQGTDALLLQRAVREFAKAEFGNHKYVTVLHEHQANPHVHLTVRAESKDGTRLNPRKADLQRWRELFAERLRAWGVDAEATRQVTRGVARTYPELWRVKAAADGRLRNPRTHSRGGAAAAATRDEAQTAWKELAAALSAANVADDRQLGERVKQFADAVGSARVPLSRSLRRNDQPHRDAAADHLR